MKYIIARPINGIFLNGLEYLMNAPEPEGEIIKFDSAQDAIDYLIDLGWSADALNEDIDTGAIRICGYKEDDEL